MVQGISETDSETAKLFLKFIFGKKIELNNLTYLIGTVQSRFSDILFSYKSRFSDNFAEDHFFST